MFKIWLFVSVFAVLAALMAPSQALSSSKPDDSRRAILLVAFGTSVPEAQTAFDRIDAHVKGAFPGVEIRWAFTSKHIRKRLAGQGKILDSPEVALARMMEEGFTHVAVLSLHIIPGQEFHDLKTNVDLFARMSGGFERVLVAQPLLSSHEDMVRTAESLIQRIPADRNPEDAIVFMGHGSRHHPADAAYAAMSYVFERMTPNVYMATVEGYPTIEQIIPELLEKGVKKVYLMPFMVVAGDHARNDMAGTEPDSWKSILSQQGLTCETVLTGLGEYPEVVQIWVDHLREIYSRL